MTDAKKVKHAIEVLTELAVRYSHEANPNCQSLVGNIISLRALLEKPHQLSMGDKKSRISDEADVLAKRLFEHIRKRKPNIATPNHMAWGLDMNRLLTIDKRTVEEVEDVIDWCQTDSFWMNNILSPFKLRQHFDRLQLQMSTDFRFKRMKALQRVKSGPTAAQKYMEKLNETNQGVDVGGFGAD